jgi:hypothetical protein
MIVGVLMPIPVWTTLDKRKLPVDRLDDIHLQRIVRMGLNAARKVIHRDALKNYAHACANGDGCEYRGAVQYAEAMREAANLADLQKVLLKNRRFAPMLAEARRRGFSVFTSAHCA